MVMPFCVVTALLRLNSMPKPMLALAATISGEVKIAEIAPGVPEFKLQTVFAAQAPMAEELEFAKTEEVLPRKKFILV